MAEFTGERVIPDQVDTDLLNEHTARYSFASRLAGARRVLDAGCGAGYGSSELAVTAKWAVGLDVSEEAVGYARQHYQRPNLRFLRGACPALPFTEACFDLVVAFEVIEHLSDWKGFLAEARRVLCKGGLFVVSTPNKLYYEESRKLHGPNPFHVHEFAFEEFRDELRNLFPHVTMFLENHTASVVFQPLSGDSDCAGRLASRDAEPGDSHFFLAVCSPEAHGDFPAFVYVPRTANVLREREHHIELLEGELKAKDAWLEKAKSDLAQLNEDHQRLLEMFRVQKSELEERNRWAERLNQEMAALGAAHHQLQASSRQMAEDYAAKVAQLEEENQAKTVWAQQTEQRLSAELETQSRELAACVDALHQTEHALEQRTEWARNLDAEVNRLGAELNLVRASRWFKLGRRLGVGPGLTNT